jgi:hypothetical protein
VRRKISDAASRPIQLSLFGESALAGRSCTDPAERLNATLDKLVRAPIRVILTDNRSSVITVKRLKNRTFQVRLHRIFAQAEPATLAALARFIRRPDRKNRKAMGDFIARHLERIREKPARKRALPLAVQGKVFHLGEILEQVKQAYQIPAPEVRISWGQRRGKRKFRAIRFGSFDEEQKLIRVHPLLDRKQVPRFFVEYIVYHELLHAVVPEARAAAGRRWSHTREFKRREKLFARYREAYAFEKRFVEERWSRRSR